MLSFYYFVHIYGELTGVCIKIQIRESCDRNFVIY